MHETEIYTHADRTRAHTHSRIEMDHNCARALGHQLITNFATRLQITICHIHSPDNERETEEIGGRRRLAFATMPDTHPPQLRH